MTKMIKVELVWDYYDEGRYSAYPHPFEHGVDEDNTVLIDEDKYNAYMNALEIIEDFQEHMYTLKSKNDLKEEARREKVTREAREAYGKAQEMIKNDKGYQAAQARLTNGI